MTGAIVITWGSPVRGRETKGLESFGKAVARFEQLAKEGRIHSHKEYISATGNSSRVAGFMIVEGNIDELWKIHNEEEQRRLLAEAQNITENFTIQFFRGGSDRAIQEEVTLYAETLAGQGLM